LIIYEELISTDEHPSTDMLYQKVRRTFPTISFDTVNRTLLTFYDMGVAGIVEGTGHPKRFDGNLNRHHHFQCIQCKKIIDLYSSHFDTLPIPEKVQGSYTVLSTTVHLEGFCETCKRDDN
jgi:Fur family peroxide stress response transcriptional regulator